VRKGKAEVRVG